MNLPLTSTCVGGRRSGYALPATMKQQTAEVQLLRLTDLEREVIDAYITLGVGKEVAAELGMKLGQVHGALIRAYERNGFTSSIQLVAAFAVEKERARQ